MQIARKFLSLLLLVSLLIMLNVSIFVRPVRAKSVIVTCQSYNIPVAIADGQPLQYHIYGELCNPASGASGTVQLLVPGGTYGHIYWDFPTVDGVAYSYRQAANAAGYSTFAIDNLGTGQSSHPDLSLLTVSGASVGIQQALELICRDTYSLW